MADSRFGPNPEGEAFDNLKDDGLRWRTEHHVGPHPPGTTVSRLELGPAADIPRLMAQGSLVQVTEGGVIVPHAADLLPGPPPSRLPRAVRPEPGSVREP